MGAATCQAVEAFRSPSPWGLLNEITPPREQQGSFADGVRWGLGVVVGHLLLRDLVVEDDLEVVVDHPASGLPGAAAVAGVRAGVDGADVVAAEHLGDAGAVTGDRVPASRGLEVVGVVDQARGTDAVHAVPLASDHDEDGGDHQDEGSDSEGFESSHSVLSSACCAESCSFQGCSVLVNYHSTFWHFCQPKNPPSGGFLVFLTKEQLRFSFSHLSFLLLQARRLLLRLAREWL